MDGHGDCHNLPEVHLLARAEGTEGVQAATEQNSSSGTLGLPARVADTT